MEIKKILVRRPFLPEHWKGLCMSFKCFQLLKASLIAALFLFNNFHWVELLLFFLAWKMRLLWEMKNYHKESLELEVINVVQQYVSYFSQPIIDEW